MKKLKKYLLLMISFSFVITGCEEVIDLDLDNAKPVIVIEANLTDQMELQTVKISRTYDFDEPNKFNSVSDANVVLTTEGGQTLTFAETNPGIYQSKVFQGRPGRKYVLDVHIDGTAYSATSVMPQRVELDSLTFKQFTAFGETNTYLAVNYNDPPEVQNQYRYILKVKDKIEETGVTEDRFSNGNKISDILFYEIDDLPAGEKLDVDFQCIDRNVFKYFYAISQISGNGGPPVAPSNPVSNFSNGALGFFSAHTTSKRSVVLK